MKRVLFLLIFFSLAAANASDLEDSLKKLSANALYYSTGKALQSAALIARVGWGISLFSPGSRWVRDECLLLSQLCHAAACHSFAQMGAPPPSPYASWTRNKSFLATLPVSSKKEGELLLFLERRWLAKAAGFYPIIVDWVCPCFGISLQVHPESESSYARDPWTTTSGTYQKRALAWREKLPHPLFYPLILTRRANLGDYLPSSLSIPQGETMETTAERVALKMEEGGGVVIVDLTDVLPLSGANSKEWMESWSAYQKPFLEATEAGEILCIQRVSEKGIGGMRLLPFAGQSKEKIEENHQFLLERVAFLGLTANRIELDRLILPTNAPTRREDVISVDLQSKEAFISYLDTFQQKWQSTHPSKKLMVEGTLHVLGGLLASISEERWSEIEHSPLERSITQFSFLRIREQLELLMLQGEEESFFTTATHLEEIHSNLCALLELFPPFSLRDFSPLYQNLLTSTPDTLKPLITCALHAAGMTSMTGIFKGVEKLAKTKPLILFGENTYYECIKTSKWVGSSVSIDEATEEDWVEADLILAQFNPALKRINLLPKEYKVENIAHYLRQALRHPREKPLTLAIDCTFDFIDSPQVGALLQAFHREIESGILNVICYRSGLKFDLFGMDNYSGAPFYMIHNGASYWDAFDDLLSDQVLTTDPLSLNWFCLAYKYAAPELELYRKQIFDNTRSLLRQVPPRLFDKSSPYHIVPVDQEANLSFIDIKVTGELHELRGGNARWRSPLPKLYGAQVPRLLPQECRVLPRQLLYAILRRERNYSTHSWARPSRG